MGIKTTGLLKYAAGVALVVGSITAQATSITFTGSGTGPGSISVTALATFDISGNTLTITLQNTSPSNNGQDVPGSTLTGLFWDLVGNPTLTPVSATLPTGSSIIQSGTCTASCNTTDVGGEWGYGTAVTGSMPTGASRGISSSGYLTTGLGGNIGNFNNGSAGADLDNPNSLDGINFGIISAAPGFNPNGGNGGLDSEPLIQDTVVFILTGVSGLTTAAISHVSFQYGTRLDELNVTGNPPPPCCIGSNPIPEPTGAGLLGLGLLALGAIRRRIA